jgi:alpha-mannosidase
MTAEKWACAADKLLGLDYPYERMQKAWENVLFNQFHDIMGGCGIKEAYQDAMESYGESLNIGAEIINSSMQKISWAVDTSRGTINYISKENDWAFWEMDDMGVPIIVFNPLTWTVRAPVQVNKALGGVADHNGKPLEIQTVRGSRTNNADKWDTLFMCSIPPMGYRTYWAYLNREFAANNNKESIYAENNLLENAYISIQIDGQTGYINRLFDKKHNVCILSGDGAVPIVIDETDSDTWAHGIFEFRNEIGKFNRANVKLLENGSLRARLRITSRYNLSVLRQDIILYNDKPDIEVRVKLDWREEHKMLKLSFPINIRQAETYCEIPYGSIKRDGDGKEEPCQQWIDVSGVYMDDKSIKYGLALLTDSKYSFDVNENDLRLTMIRSPIFADHYGQRDDLCEFSDQGVHEFKYMLAPHAGTWREAEIVKKAYELNVPLAYIAETYHKGVLPQYFEGIKISGGSIVASVLKKSEDKNGFILRCYETNGKSSSVVIEIPMLNKKWESVFGEYEIKTFLVPNDDDKEVYEVNLIEMA